MNAKEILKHENIILRPITESDTDLIVTWRNRDSVKNNFLYRSDFTAENHQKWLKEKVATGNVVQFIIEIVNDSKTMPVGSVYLRDIDYENSSAEFGIFIGEEAARGKGVGTTASKMILKYGHNELGLHRIFLRLVAENIAAYKSYRKAGFVSEGIFRDMKKIDGKFVDIMFMSSIKTIGGGGYSSIVKLCSYSSFEVAA